MKSAPAQKPTIVFDFDGTIADSFALILEIFHSLVPGNDEVSDEQIEVLRSLSARHAARALGVPFWKIPLLVSRGRKVMRERVDEVTMFPGLAEVFQGLHAQGYALHIVSSNSEDNIRMFLRRYNIEDCITSVTGGVSLFGKPRALQKLCRAYSLVYDQVWYVGDEVRDVVAAHKVRVHVIAVGWGFNHPNALQEMNPDELVTTPTQLQAVIERI